MSEEEKKTNEVDVNALQAQIDDLSGQLGKVNNKNQELISEKRAVQAARDEAEQTAKIEAEEKLKASSNFKELHKSSELEREKLQNELNDLRGKNEKKEVKVAAMDIASSLAEGKNIKNLSKLIIDRLKYTSEGVKVLNESGELTVSTLEEFKQQVQSSGDYDSLLKGNQSSGGGANGGKNGGSAASNKTQTSTQRIADGLRNL